MVSQSTASAEIKLAKPANFRKVSMADIILSVLWHFREATLRIIDRHPYARIFSQKKSKNTYATSLTRLRKQKLIQKKGRETFVLTPEGRKKALFAFINTETRVFKQKQSRWDGGWRIIFFDIPEKKRKYRDYLRLILKTIGFKEFQRSVWIYPYQVPAFLQELLFEENIKQYTRFITTEHIEYDKDLRKLFNVQSKRGIFT